VASKVVVLHLCIPLIYHLFRYDNRQTRSMLLAAIIIRNSSHEITPMTLVDREFSEFSAAVTYLLFPITVCFSATIP